MPEDKNWWAAVEVLDDHLPHRPLTRRLRMLEAYQEVVESYIDQARAMMSEERVGQPHPMSRKDALRMAADLGHRIRRQSRCARCGKALWRIVDGAEEGIGGRIVDGIACVNGDGART